MASLTHFLTKHAKLTLISGIILLLAAGVYGAGLFNTLKTGDNFYASDSKSKAAQDTLVNLYGKGDTDTIVILLEKKSGVNVDLKSPTAALEATRIFKALDIAKTQSYYSTQQDLFVSTDGSATYAVVNLDGTDSNAKYDRAKAFATDTKSDMFDISIGGGLVGRTQTQDQVKEDLSRAELISLPILAVLLFLFFRSPVAAALPLSMSILTIAGGLAVARLVDMLVSVDTYSLNVITILGVGLSIDYCLLAVNRFREELARGETVEQAVHRTARTAGRTIFFSGLTVAICLLSLLLFPVGFMHSVAIGGAAAVAVAVIISTLLLPSALRVVGKNIDKWHIGKKKVAGRNGWGRAARFVTSHPIFSIITGLAIIGFFVWPVFSFKTEVFDWHVLPNNQSAYHVGKVLNDKFTTNTSSITILANFGHAPTASEICTLTNEIRDVANVKAVDTAYTQLESLSSCTTSNRILRGLQYQSPQTYQYVEAYAGKYIKGNYVRIDVTSQFEPSDSRTFALAEALRAQEHAGISTEVTGTSMLSKDTLDAYTRWIPVVGAVIVLAMVVILSLLLGSFVIPFQAVVINSLSLLIALGILVVVFQFGWGSSFLHTVTTGGFEPSIPILAIVMAFGLSMDYAVFLYSRIHEVYDLKNDVTTSIVEGVAKTGPIISAAAILMFVVVSAFGLSHVVLIQQIGVGLGVAVLVDAFFVRIFFVPAVMKLFGRASWVAPAWLKKITIKHE
jgi:RND superfamily putative drug exporter